MKWLLSLVLGLAAAGSGCKGDLVKCDLACRNYAKLTFWDRADREIAAAPADQREALRKQKLAAFESDLAKGLDICTTQCASANKEDDIDCMVEAKTAAAAKACVGN